jgi:hypothetical protein
MFADAELLPGVESFVAATVAVLLRVPQFTAEVVPVTVTDRLVPDATDPKLQLRLLPPVIVQPTVAVVQVMPEGSVSVIVTPFAVTPDAELVAVIVKLAVAPALIVGVSAVFVIETSVVATPLKVTVNVPLGPMTTLHGLFVPLQGVGEAVRSA